MTKKRGATASAATTTSSSSSAASTNKKAPSTTTTTTTGGNTPTTTTLPNQTLPSKHEALFRNLIKFYEEKQYQTALSYADNILRDYPQHGDTMAMKALLTRYLKEQELNKRVEFNTNFYFNKPSTTINTTITTNNNSANTATSSANSGGADQQQQLMIYDKTYKKDCYSMVKKALELVNNKSFICWHVYGLMYKEDFKTQQAITCFQNSLKFQPTNEVQAWRELSNLQVHSRDYKGAIESRRKLIELKPGIGAFWLGYTVVQHLSGNLTGAIQTLDKYMTALFEEGNKDSKNYKYEKSELLLYLCQLMYENGQFKECVDSLLANTKFLCDELSTLELLADCYIKLNQLDHAKKITLQLIRKNSEDYSYYGKYQLACGFLTSENRLLLNNSSNSNSNVNSNSNSNENNEIAFKLYELFTTSEDLKEFREKSPVLKMIILSLCPPYTSNTNGADDSNSDSNSIEEFKKVLISFVEPYFSKTIPSLFKILKLIYQLQPHKVPIIEQTMLDRLKLEESNNSADPTILLWIYIYLCQHYDAIEQYQIALNYVNRAIEHTPTLIELYMLKAKFYKHLFNYEQAALSMEQARQMDLSDRYLNTKASKYWTRHNEIIKADEMIGIFAKHPKDPATKKEEEAKEKERLKQLSITKDSKDSTTTNTTDSTANANGEEKEEKEKDDPNLIAIENDSIYHRNNVHDMQAMWFENECGDAHYRMGELSMAIRRYYYTVQHFMEIWEDQFDFHTYSIRKMTLRSYIEMMRFNDRLYTQYFYYHAVCGLLNVYLELIKQQEENSGSGDGGSTVVVEYSMKNDYVSNFQNIDLRRDEDLNGVYLSTKINLFDECTKYLKQLEEYHPMELSTHIYGVTLYLKAKKYLLASKALKKAIELSSPQQLDYRVHLLKFQYLYTISLINENDSLYKLLQMDYQKITLGQSLNDLNEEQYKKNNSNGNILNTLAYLAVKHLIGGKSGSTDSTDSDSSEMLLNCVDVTSSSLRDCVIAYSMLSSGSNKKRMTNRPYKKQDYKISAHLDFTITDSDSIALKLADKIESVFNIKL